MSAHPYVVQGWQAFDFSGHGRSQRKETVEWDGQEKTWPRVKEEILRLYVGRTNSLVPWSYGLNAMFDDMLEAQKKIAAYAKDYYYGSNPMRNGRAPDRMYFKSHYAKHCRRWNALLRYFMSNTREVEEVARDIAEPPHSDNTLREKLGFMRKMEWDYYDPTKVPNEVVIDIFYSD